MQTTRSTARVRRLAVGGILLATAVGAVLRFCGLSSRDFWFDESCTFIYVHNLFNWPAGSNLLVESTNLPYYVLLRGWTALFGESEAAYRSFSALCATLTMPIVACAAWRMRGTTAAVLCAAIAALHPLHLYYAREARAYALWILVLSICLVLLIEAVKRNTWRWWALFALAAWACLHVHYFTAFWLPATAAATWLAQLPSQAFRRWLVTFCVVIAGFLPYFLLAVLPAARAGGSAWIAESFDPMTAVPKSLWAMLPAGAYPGHLRGLSLESPDKSVPQPPVWVFASQVIPATAVATLALVLLRRRSSQRENAQLLPGDQGAPAPRHSERSEESPARRGSIELERLRCVQHDTESESHSSPATHLSLACLTLGPLVLAWAYSMLVRPVYLVGRYDLAAWPAVVIWLSLLTTDAAFSEPRASASGSSNGLLPCSRGSDRTASGLRLMLWSAVLLLPALAPVHRVVAFRPPPSLHHVRAERLAKLAGPGDLVIAFSYDRDHLAYYLHRAGFGGTVRSFPTWLEKQVGWVDTEADLSPRRLAEAEIDAIMLAEQAAQRMRSGDRVFLLADSVDSDGNGPRRVIHTKLADVLAGWGLTVYPIDTELLIYELGE